MKDYVMTNRESQIVTLLAEGKGNKEIATALSITEATIKIYISALYKKTGLTRYTVVKLILRDKERVRAVKLNEWIRKWGVFLPMDGREEINKILAEQVSSVLKEI